MLDDDAGAAEDLREVVSPDANAGNKRWVLANLVAGEVDIIHTAVEADEHALELHVDAAGFGDVKGVDVDYITGALSAGEDEGVILINIDEIDATGGDVFAFEALATEGSAKIYGLKVGVLIGPVHQDSGTFVNPTTATDNTTSVDVSNMLDGDSGTTTAIFESDNEYIIVGGAAVFEEMEFILTTGSSGGGIRPTFWYSTAGAGQFTQFTPVDGTDGFRNTGVVAWDASDLTAHGINTDTGTYDIKIIRTRNSLSTSPVLGFVKTASTTEFVWDKEGNVNINGLTLAGDLTMANGGKIGQSAGPELTFNDTDNILKLTGADYFNVSDGNVVSTSLLTTDKIIVTAFDIAPGISIVSVGPDTNDRAVFKGVRADGTLASPTAPADGDLVLSVLGAIFDSVNNEATALMNFFVDGAVSSNVAPQGIMFDTSATTAGNRATRLTIKAAGNVGLSTIDPQDVLHVIGRMRLQDNETDATTKSSRFRFGHYTNMEEPITGFLIASTVSASLLNIGGGSGIENSVTGMDFYVGANNTTVTGTRSVSIRLNKMGINNAAPQATLHVDQSSASGAIPVLVLDQGDIDDVFINYIGTSAADATRSVSSSVAETAAPAGYVRVKINGGTRWMRFYNGVT